MCCIFTCCGWLIDLFQRAWVFAMSFCMSGAICCVLMLGSMSGVALGYNYSLAEYMDLKETNVSVYLKRGVFDDEGMGDDMNFRRSGGEEEEGFDQMPNQQRRSGGGRQNDDSSTMSGRRLDDSLLQSNQNHGYEGGLVKLTMAPPYAITTTTPISLKDDKINDIIMKHAPESLNQLKAIQSLIGYRKALAAREHGKPEDPLIGGYPAHLISGEENYVPPHILNAQPSPGRRSWQAPATRPDQYNTFQNYMPRKIHPALIAVPPPGISDQQYWEAYKSSKLISDEYVTAATAPQAIRMITMDQDMFPTEPSTYPVFTEETEPMSSQGTPTQFMNLGLDTGDQFQQKRILDNYETSRTKPYAMRGNEDITSPKSDNEYYDDDIKGLPVRRKRHIHGLKREKKSQNMTKSEQEKSDGKNSDKVNTVNHNNDMANTDPSISVSKLVSESKLNTKASDLISKLEKTPLYDQFSNNKVYETESRIFMRGILGKTSLGLNKIKQKLNDASSADPGFFNQRRFVFSFV